MTPPIRHVDAASVSTQRPNSLVPAALAVFGVVSCVGALVGLTIDSFAPLQSGGAILAADEPGEGETLPVDSDGDGLNDDYEWVLRSHPDIADTDGDGFSDLEEFARGSSAFISQDTPLPADVALHMTARKGEDDVYLLVATYSADGVVANYATSLGLYYNDAMLLIPAAYVESRGTTNTILSEDGSSVTLIELPIRDILFSNGQGMTAFCMVANSSTGTVISADVIDFYNDDASIFLRTHQKNRPSSRADLATATNQGGSVYIPLPPPGQAPSTWNPGQICRQVSTVIGYADGIVSREITSAECVSAFDSYCKSDCTLSVGTVEKSVDPLALIGG